MGFPCPTANEQRILLDAITAGDITIYGFGFNAELETYSGDLLRFGITLSKDIAAKAGIPPPRSISQRDVPGTTRGIISHLNAMGIRAFSIGANTFVRHLQMPPVFKWLDQQSASSIYVLYISGGYGGVIDLNTTDAKGNPFKHIGVFDWR